MDICLLQETYLRKGDQAKFQEIKDRGWEILSAPRKERTGGGVAVIYRAEMGVKRNNTRNFATFEHMEVVFENSTELFRLINIYRPPYSKKAPYTQSHFLSEFKDFLDDLGNKVGKSLIMGDFNFHMERPAEFYPNKLQQLLTDFGLLQLVPIEPTHTHGGTLDLAIIDNQSTGLCKGVEIVAEGTTSDHHLLKLDLQLETKIVKRKRPETVWYRDFDTLDLEKFTEELRSSELLTDMLSEPDVDSVVEKFYSTLTELVDKHCPMKKRRKKDRYTPWMDEELSNLRRKKRRAERKWRKTKTRQEKTQLKTEYVELRAQFNKMESAKRSEYVRRNIQLCGKDSKRLNQQLNRLLGKSAVILPDMPDKLKLATEFGDFFSSKIDRLQEKIDMKTGDLEPKSQCMVMETPDVEKMEHFQQFNEEEVLKLIKELPDKSCDLDPVPMHLLKQLVPMLLPVLTHIVNRSLQSGVFPSCLKQAIVKPTIKNPSGDIDSLPNYRPVSNLSILSKLLEKAVNAQLNDHLVKNNLQGQCQSGFRPGHSCETHMVRVVDDVLAEMDRGNIVAVIQIDLSAAFDTIDHGQLLRRLEERYGIGSTVLTWFSSYLANRGYKVKVENSFSPEFSLKYGVPQGSLLGPVLFVLYVEPLEPIVKAFGLTIRLYADDSTIYLGFCPVEGWKVTKETIQSCLEAVRSWMIENQLW